MIGGKTLRRYIGWKFLVAILGTFLTLGVLIFMIDFVELLRQSGKHGNVSTWRLATIALLRLPAYTEFLIAFAMLTGSIAALLMLSRKSELSVMRAGGMSVWQFLTPGMLVALALGVLSVVAFNPMAASGRALAEKYFAEAFGRESNMFQSKTGGSWLRQDGADGQSVLSAISATDKGLKLIGVTGFVFDHEGRFIERLDAGQAELKDGYWQVRDAWVVRPGKEPEKFDTYLLSTYLTPERAQDALGTVFSVSFWELPDLIEVAEKAKLSTERLRIQLEVLLSRPLLCVTMVLLAATVSLRSFRSGGIQTMVMTGMLGGFSFFLLSEVSRQIGVAGFVAPWVAVWLPILLASLIALTVLMHQEDG